MDFQPQTSAAEPLQANCAPPPLHAGLIGDQRREVALPRLQVVARFQALLLGVQPFELRFECTVLLVVVHAVV